MLDLLVAAVHRGQFPSIVEKNSPLYHTVVPALIAALYKGDLSSPFLMCPEVFAAITRNALCSPSHQRPLLAYGKNLANRVAMLRGGLHTVLVIGFSSLLSTKVTCQRWLNLRGKYIMVDI